MRERCCARANPHRRHARRGAGVQRPQLHDPASLGRQAGANLFHSFGVFNVPPPAARPSRACLGTAVSNIISRVTGGQASLVDGLLASTIANANLFLINPRGIVFGPGASLDLTGSFHASTAHYLQLADCTRFDATATVPADPLTAAARPRSGSSDRVPRRSTFGRELGSSSPRRRRSVSLVGGPVQRVRRVARHRRAATCSSSAPRRRAKSRSPRAPTAATALAPVTIQRSDLVAGSALDDFGQVVPPGRIVIRGGELKIADSLVFSNSFSSAAAPPVELTSSGNVELSASAQINVFAQRAGRGADIVVRGENVTIGGGALVQSLSNPGAAGDIDVAARDALRVVAAPTDPRFTTILVETQGPGDGGAIRLRGDTPSASRRRSSRTGPAVRAAADRSCSRGATCGFVDGAFVTTETSPGSTGAGGSLQVRATARFLAEGQDRDGNPWLLGEPDRGAGNGGNVSIQAPDVRLSGGIRRHPALTRAVTRARSPSMRRTSGWRSAAAPVRRDRHQLERRQRHRRRGRGHGARVQIRSRSTATGSTP